MLLKTSLDQGAWLVKQALELGGECRHGSTRTLNPQCRTPVVIADCHASGLRFL